MPRKIRNWRKPNAAAVRFLRDTLEAPPGRQTFSAGGSKADAYRFRQQLYVWRRDAIEGMGLPESPQYAENVRWLTEILGRRGTIEWLDLTTFSVEQDEQNPDLWRVIGVIRPPMYGELPAEAPTETDLDDVRNLIANAMKKGG